jgi:hypothetical protein
MPIKVDELRFIPRGTPAVRRPAGELSVFLDRSDSTLKAIDAQGNIGSVVSGSGITRVVSLSQEDYVALGSPDPATLYVIA